MIVGTMNDLDDQKEIPFKEAQKYAKSQTAQYFETSAKDGTNISEMFQVIGNQLLTIANSKGFGQGKTKSEKLKNPSKKKKKKHKSKCC